MSLKEKLQGFLRVERGKKNPVNNDDYVNLELEDYEAELRGEGVKMYVKIAELTGLYDVPELRKEIYEGNMVILDISLAKHDKVVLEKAIKDLKMAAMDINGDIAGIGDDYVIIVPMGVKIERKKIKSS